MKLLQLMSLFLLTTFLPSQSHALNSDGVTLLSFKYAVLSDPLSVLDSWSYHDITPCSWTGVFCDKKSEVVTSLVLPNSQLSGTISADLSLISSLEEVDLSGNFFKGTLPMSILDAANLRKLNLADNRISGDIPALIAVLPSLKLLNLSANAITGKIPGGFKFIEVLDLSSNLLSGSVPVNFDGGEVKYLDISSNKLSGSIPSQFALDIPGNATVDLSFNNFTGEIPKMAAFLNQRSEAFAGNEGLCGKPLPLLCSIPSTLSIPPELNTSTPAIAAIPKTISSDPALEAPGSSNADVSQTRRLQPMAIAGIVIGDVAGLGLLAFVIFFVHQMNNSKLKKPDSEPPRANQNPMKKTPDTHQITILQNSSPSSDHHYRLFSSWSCWNATSETDTSCTNSEPEIATPQTGRNGILTSIDETVLEMETLLKASAYILSTTNSSIVYKTVTQNGVAFAVRRIGDGCLKKMKDFEAQIRTIAKLRHPNLVRTLGFYWGDDEKLVVYDFVANGSLASAINRKQNMSATHLNLEMRLRIARGLARGLSFIHEKKQIHGNIKPSNILLDSDYEPVISDLGLDRLISKPRNEIGSMRSHASRDGLLLETAPSSSGGGGSPYTSVSNGSVLMSSSPYQAPESFRNLKPSAKWDVYSFGVVLIELLTGKGLHGFELRPWTEEESFSTEDEEARILRMVDVAIRNDVAVREDATLECFKIGFRCANLSPVKRPTMKEVVQALEKVVVS